jgi:predicted AAA+ superfamily ATPase
MPGLSSRRTAATSIPRDIAEQESAINPRDAVDDSLALADRFGLSLGFHVDRPGQAMSPSSRAMPIAHGLPFDPVEAVGWATRRGSRSGGSRGTTSSISPGGHGKSL